MAVTKVGEGSGVGSGSAKGNKESDLRGVSTMSDSLRSFSPYLSAFDKRSFVTGFAVVKRSTVFLYKGTEVDAKTKGQMNDTIATVQSRENELGWG
jgi:hypothetical protein